MGLIEKIQASKFSYARTCVARCFYSPSTNLRKPLNTLCRWHLSELELYRLEQRYTRREKRTTFISEAQYVDGEYIYVSSPVSTKSISTSTSSQRIGKGPAVRIRELARAGTGKS